MTNIPIKDIPFKYDNIFSHFKAMYIIDIPNGWDRATIGVRKKNPILIYKGEYIVTDENTSLLDRVNLQGNRYNDVSVVIQYQPKLDVTFAALLHLKA
jgi:hypothetical protein